MPPHSISRRTFLGITGAVSTFPFTRLLGQQPPAAPTGLDFPLVDYHVHVEGGTTIEHVLQLARQRGVRVGIAEHGGVGEGMKTDEDMRHYFARWAGQPVYRGMQGGELTWPKMFSKEMIAQLDYVLSDALIFPEKDGRLVELWTPAAVITDAQDFMERYVAFNLQVMDVEPIDILANATFLPDDIVHDYGTLWTEARMEKVIETARRHTIAIEISGLYKIPSKKFILKAKAAGIKFSFGSNTHGEDVGRVEYGIQMAKECGLSARNMFTPPPHDLKPIIRRGA
jgi:histidinol phosphatase-like PHP family hydrolase